MSTNPREIHQVPGFQPEISIEQLNNTKFLQGKFGIEVGEAASNYIYGSNSPKELVEDAAKFAEVLVTAFEADPDQKVNAVAAAIVAIQSRAMRQLLELRREIDQK